MYGLEQNFHTAGSVTSIILNVEVDLEHFIRVVMEKQEILAEGLNDDVFPGSEIMETEQGATVFHSRFHALLEQQSRRICR